MGWSVDNKRPSELLREEEVHGSAFIAPTIEKKAR